MAALMLMPSILERVTTMNELSDDIEPGLEDFREAIISFDPARLTALVEAAIANARPGIQRDGGDIELTAIEHGVVRVKLSGACTHCKLAGQTLGGIRRELVRVTGLPLRVLPALQ